MECFALVDGVLELDVEMSVETQFIGGFIGGKSDECVDVVGSFFCDIYILYGLLSGVEDF